MSPAIIYRLECRDGRGVYVAGLAHSLRTLPYPFQGDTPQRPAPSEDTILCEILQQTPNIKYDWHYGFGSLTQLCQWFNRLERKELFRNKVLCNAYVAMPGTFVIGDTQALFNKSKAHRVGKQTISHNP